MAGIYDPEIVELLGGPPSASSDESVPVSFQGADRHGTDLMIAGDAYEGANRFSHELASYVPSTRSPDQDIKPGKRTADARARDLTRNDANIQSGVRLRQDGVVGAMFLPNPRPNSDRLFGKEDVKWEDEHADEACERLRAGRSSRCGRGLLGSDGGHFSTSFRRGIRRASSMSTEERVTRESDKWCYLIAEGGVGEKASANLPS